MASRYVIGIDLGTTNSVVAYCELGAQHPEVQVLPIPQLVAPGTVAQRPQLPSYMYLPASHESAAGAYDLPWRVGSSFAIGELARTRAASAPERTVGGAKSWLCHSKVDRRQPILPWAPGLEADASDITRVSPVLASQRYLEHLVATWNQSFPESPLHHQLVVLTVPASFDAAARELTREAALAAGLPDQFVLLEEPQAAVYAWLVSTGDRWRQTLRVGDTLLVCDVGGGTTDLTMVGVGEEQGELTLQRIAVGEHLLVGGDNMDLALAHHAAERFAAKGISLNPWQSVSLWHACRQAKESMLAEGGAAAHTVSVLGRGSKLIGGTVSLEIDRQQVVELLRDGFFPRCGLADRPARRRGSGFQEVGLPYAADVGITRHVAAFVQSHTRDGRMPVTQVLFNGGVFKAAMLRQRLLEVIGSWSDATAPQELAGDIDLDFAVARGAAYYGWTKQHGGVRIRGGTARSYYVGIETSGLAIPGAPRPLRALCVVPFGMEEGTACDVPSAPIGLVVGEPAQFRFFSSAARQQDRPGDLLPSWTDEELAETDPLETTLAAESDEADTYLPVKFQSKITELGMFELWCVSTQGDRRWKLEFNVRPEQDD